MIWDDIKYQNEYALPYGPKREVGFKVAQDKDLLNFMKNYVRSEELFFA